jgi:hypothetical protein
LGPPAGSAPSALLGGPPGPPEGTRGQGAVGTGAGPGGGGPGGGVCGAPGGRGGGRGAPSGGGPPGGAPWWPPSLRTIRPVGSPPPWGRPGGPPGDPPGPQPRPHFAASRPSLGPGDGSPPGTPPGGPPRASFGTPSPNWGRSPERRRGANSLLFTLKKQRQERGETWCDRPQKRGKITHKGLKLGPFWAPLQGAHPVRFWGGPPAPPIDHC